jgi:acetyltransferase-like isoleucine patch superfamily enzyme
MTWRTPIQFLHRIGMGLASRGRNVYYRTLGVEMTGYCWLRDIEIGRNWRDIFLEEGVSLDNGVVIVTGGAPKPGKVTIRANTYVNRYTIFDGHESIEIGRRCMIGPHCYITDGDHTTEPGQSVQSQPMRKAPVILEDEVWLGSHVVILPGVRIGHGAVVGAGSVVSRSIPANAIAYGVPARVMRMRGETIATDPVTAVK